MFFLEKPPTLIETSIFTAMPETFRRKGEVTPWSRANKGGQAVESFIEGPSFDKDGQLYIVDIPFGRVFRISPAGEWALVAEYDGLPNGLRFTHDGQIVIADYKNGLMQLDPVSGKVTTLLNSRNGERFKGINDLAVASNGDIFFTDQGQTGLHDPSGRVFRLSTDGKLDCLLSTGISPNGLVLDPSETTLYVAMTRDNSVWRVPLLPDGGVSKVHKFCSMFGTSGPDGLAIDTAGNLLVAHASLAHVLMFAPNGEWIAKIKTSAGTTLTNMAYGGRDLKDLYITDSMTGTILRAKMPTAGFSLPRRR